MKFSIFTPTHDLSRIDTPFQSLLNQSFKDFEWVILLNGKALEQEEELLTSVQASELNLKIIRDETENKNIGYLKKLCCNAASGEILVELDHDDALTPDCLEELSIAFEGGHDFCYSDDYYIEVGEDNKEKHIAPFSAQWGWKTQKDSEGNPYHPTPLPSPLAFSYIWYSPDHVRSWKKEFYDKIGGHDESLDVCDDY